MAQIVSGLSGSGLDVASLVNSLMSVERLPQQRLTAAKSDATSRAAAWGDLVTRVGALKTTAAALTGLATINAPVVTSSNTGVLTAATTGTPSAGAIAMRVTSLATAGQLASPTFASGSSEAVPAGVTGGRAVVASGVGLGAVGVGADDTAAEGAHSIVVTRASAGASLTGGRAPVTFSSAQTLTLTLDDGSTRTASFAAGTTYSDSASLVSALQSQLGSDIKVGTQDGALVLSTSGEGSARTLTASGSAATTLALPGATASGTDAEVSLDGGDPVTVSALDGSTATDLGEGISLTAGRHLALGTVSATVVDLEQGSTLSDVAAAISAAGGPAAATVVDTGGSGTRLVLTAKGTGTAAGISLTTTGTTGFESGFETVRAAKDATLTFGSLTVTRPTNTITDVVSGVTLSLVKADPDNDVVLDVSRDTEGLVSKAKSLVDAINSTQASIATKTKYNISSNSGAPLVGESAARDVLSRLSSALGGIRGTGSIASLGALGIRAQRDGTYTLDEAVFRKAFADAPNDAAGVLDATASAVGSVADAAAGPGGTLRARQDAASQQATDLQASIDKWDDRLTAIQNRYQAQFAKLDAALGSLKSQSSWLSGQLSGLAGWSRN